mmetsp:Transcript_29302/g.54321  ORF Transcript_29302/g.54321 Transcript_29302/m.54321 type:complete len:226 (+) Transcript_29302:54-731(+)
MSMMTDSEATRLAYIDEVEKCTSASELCMITKQYCLDDKAQGAFAFNRMKKVMSHFGLISEMLKSKSYGLLGKHRGLFFDVFNQALSPDIVECLKDAAVYDSRSKIAHRSQDLYPSRNGITRTTPIKKPRQNKKRKSSVSELDGGGEDSKLLSPLLNKLDGKPPSSVEVDLTASSAAEVEEKVRSIKAQRLADAMHHPSYAKLEQEQKDLIKHEWISSLLGLEDK